YWRYSRSPNFDLPRANCHPRTCWQLLPDLSRAPFFAETPALWHCTPPEEARRGLSAKWVKKGWRFGKTRVLGQTTRKVWRSGRGISPIEESATHRQRLAPRLMSLKSGVAF